MTKPDDSNDNKTARDFTKNRNEFIRVADWRDDGLWIIVTSNGGRNFCTYIGLPVDHPLAGYDYDLLPVECHGGLTYGREGDGEFRPEGYYWYGWDYGHYNDYSYWGREDQELPLPGEKDWTLKEVKEDALSAIWDMAKLRKLAESIYSKAKS